jgi:predicted dithiol-disulfide oxidoreductase (DUF899 family)
MSPSQSINDSIPDYVFKSQAQEPVRLSELFGDQETLVMVHNMGSHCPFCTDWADDFNRIVPELTDRVAFVVESADDPAVQRGYHASRGWNFNMVSSQGIPFKADMGFVDGQNKPIGGVSVFKRKAGGIIRTRRDAPTPADDSSSLGYFLGLLAD